MKRKALHHIAVCAFQVHPGDVVQLFPAGTFAAPRGSMRGTGPWRIDAKLAAALIRRVSQRKNDIPVDYEHQILNADENGKPAPAAGWIDPQSLEWREGEGLFAAVKWTDRAREHIQADEYRYISPVFPYDKKSGGVLDLLHVSLVNVPAIDGMASVSTLAAAKFGLEPTQPNQEEPQMEELLNLFGLAPDASEDDAVAALKALQEKVAGLEGQLAKKDEAIAAAKAGAPDPAKFVPIEALKELQTEVAALKAGSVEREVEDLLKPAIEDGRIRGEAMETWARDLGKSDIAALKTYLDNAQPVAALKGNQSGGKKPGGADTGGELDDTALAVCKQMGVDPEEYKKTLAEEAA